MVRLLDEVDLRLIALLQADGRQSNVNIAQELALGEATVRRRLERLIADKVLRLTAVVDPTKVGLATAAMITVQGDPGRVDEIARQLAALPETQSVCITAGRWDIIVEAAFSTDQQLLSFLQDRVANIPGVRRTETSHVLRQLKRAGDWALSPEVVNPTVSTVEPEMLRQTEILTDLNDEELALIANVSHLRTYETGTRIFSENEEARELFILEQGRVSILVDIGQGRLATMGIVSPHSAFGWPALVPPYIYMDTARCAERTRVIAFPATVLRELCLNNCRACYSVMEKVTAVISSRLNDARFQLIHVLQAGEPASGS